MGRKEASPRWAALELEGVEGRAAALVAEVLLLVVVDGSETGMPVAGMPVAARTRVAVSAEVAVSETGGEV